jgi:hypothetical protein
VAILFSRKVWVQSVLPLFSLLAIAAWWRRGRRWGAFAWGFVGACLGQIHMSGFFLAGGFAAWTVLFDRRSARWRWWLAGSVLGALTLIPWIGHVLSHGSSAHRGLLNVARLWFWRMWLAHPLGLDMRESFGSDFDHFLAYPGGTHGVAIAYLAILAATVWIAIGAARALWPRRGEWRALLLGRESDTTLALGAAFWGFGILLTLTGLFVYRHYLIVAFVLPFLFVAWAALLRPAGGRRALAVVCVAEALLSAGYLGYIHSHHGAPGGDYGVTYAAQRR